MSQVDDLEVTLASDARFEDDANAALVGLCRLLAAQVDDAGDKPATHLMASYLSALKDLRRISETQPKGASRAHDDDSSEKPSLEQLRGNVTAIGKARKRA